MKTITYYHFNPDESYSTSMSFPALVEYVQYTSGEKGFSLFEDLLIIQIPEGVFIRTTSREWCETFTHLAEKEISKDWQFQILKEGEWDRLTTRYRAPIESFGDARLVRWRVGFF
jgi:hypothetical protein